MTWTLSAFADEAGDTMDQQIAALKKAGLTHIDPRSVEGHNITQLPLDLAKQVQSKLEQASITVSMYGSPIGKIDIADDFQIDLDRLEHLAKLRDIFGCNAVRMFSYFNKAGVAPKQWRAEALDRLKRLKDRAGELDMVLYHENESDIYGDHPEQVLDLAEQLRDGKTFRLIYDFANYVRTPLPAWDCWQMFKNHTDCFHFKDQRRDDQQHVPMGQSPDTEAERILRDAHASGWTGPCTLEPHLSHSKAVLATGPSGGGNQSLANVSPAESFQIAADAAKNLLDRIDVDYV